MEMVDAFAGMTYEEVAALDDDALELLIRRACAEAGVPMQDGDPPEPPASNAAEYDTAYYEVPAMLFAHKGDAESVAQLAMQLPRVATDYDYILGCTQVTLRPNDTAVDVQTRLCYTIKTYERLKQALAAHAAAQDQYKRDKLRYDEHIAKRAAVVEPILQSHASAVDLERECARTDQRFAEYLDIANGDVNIAEAFLRKAFKVPEVWRTPQTRTEMSTIKSETIKN